MNRRSLPNQLRRRANRALAIAFLVGASPLHAASPCKIDEVSLLPVSMHGMRALIPAKVNGHGTTMIVDTGMSPSMLISAAMEELGLGRQPLKSTLARGVTGTTLLQSTDIGVIELGGLRFRDVKVFVGGSGSNYGASGLLGRDLLGHADVEYDFANGIIRFLKLHECEGFPPVYWKSGSPVNTLPIVGDDASPHSGVGRQIMTTVLLNGVALRATLDSGAGVSMVSERYARAAGVTPETPGVVSAPMAVGLGGRPVKTWIGTFSRLRIGSEEINNARLRFGNLDSRNVDIFLGTDFFLSHRLIVADSQRTIYATYNGGVIFDPGTVLAVPESVSSDAVEPAARAGTAPHFPDHNAPTDAASFGRRGMAFMSRRDYAHAIADFSRASELDGGEAGYFLQRGQAYLAAGQLSAARADFDAALKLKPDFVEARAVRAAERIDNGNRSGAGADLDAAASHADATADIRFELAAMYVRIGRPSQAMAQIDAWSSTHAGDSKMPAAQNIRCLTRGLLNTDLDNALQACNAALDSQPMNVAGLSNRGLVRFRAGQYEAALADFDAALKLKPDLAVTLYRRGIVKRRLGRSTEGNADLIAARALDANIDTNEHAFDIIP